PSMPPLPRMAWASTARLPQRFSATSKSRGLRSTFSFARFATNLAAEPRSRRLRLPQVLQLHRDALPARHCTIANIPQAGFRLPPMLDARWTQLAGAAASGLVIPSGARLAERAMRKVGTKQNRISARPEGPSTPCDLRPYTLSRREGASQDEE